TVGADLHAVLGQFFLLAEAHLSGDVGAGDGQRAGFPTATIGLDGGVAHQRLDRLHGVLELHRRVAGVVIHVAHTLDAVNVDALFRQVLMNVDEPTAGEDTFGCIAGELVVAGAAAVHYRLDVEVVQGSGKPVEQHTIVGDD